MTHGLAAFEDELSSLTKKAGLASYVGKKVVKNPLHALGALSVVLPAAAAASRGYSRGKAMGKPARYLKASRYGPSEAAYINWNRLLSRKKLRKDQLERLHENYSESAMKR